MRRLRIQWTVNWERENEQEYLEHIKKSIKEAREDAGFTQAELAENLNRTQSYFSKLENLGRRSLVPSIIDILGIAQFTKKPIQFFLPIQDTSEDILTGKEWQLIAHFRRIDNEDTKDLALSTLKTFAETKPKGKK